MASQAPAPQLSPILRLDVDTLALVSRYLVGSEVLSLAQAGNEVLASRLRRGVEELSLAWHAPRYMDISCAFRAATLFPHLSRFEFRSPGASKRYWKPIDWSLLPSRLEHLKLCFDDSIGEFLSIDEKDVRWPLLRTLYLQDFTYSEVVEVFARTRTIDLRRLPPLTELSLRSASRSIPMCAEHLLELPTQLKALELDILALHDVDIDGRSRGPRAISVALPLLPEGLQRLSLRYKDTFGAHSGWHVMATALPKTLQSLIIHGTGTIAINPSVHLPSTPSLDLRGAAAHLTELHTLTVDTAHLISLGANLVDYLPTTLTSLSSTVNPDALQIVRDLPLYIASSIRHCNVVGQYASVLQLFTAPGPLRLTSMYMGTRSSAIVLPPTLTYLKMLEVRATVLPEALEELSVTIYVSPDVTTSSWGRSLKVLQLGLDCRYTEALIRALPDTLQVFIAPINRPTWTDLIVRLSQPSENLPLLRKIKNHTPLPYHCMFNLPSRIKALNFCAEPKHLENPLVPLNLGAIESLKIVSQHAGSNSSERKMLAILFKILPKTLKTLHIRAFCPFYPRMEISWPPHLFEFTFRYVNAYIGKIQTEETAELSGPLTKFPESLQRLTLYNMSGLPQECLPSHLSVFQILVTASNDEAAQYFQSRIPPSTEALLSDK